MLCFNKKGYSPHSPGNQLSEYRQHTDPALFFEGSCFSVALPLGIVTDVWIVGVSSTLLCEGCYIIHRIIHRVTWHFIAYDLLIITEEQLIIVDCICTYYCTDSKHHP